MLSIQHNTSPILYMFGKWALLLMTFKEICRMLSPNKTLPRKNFKVHSTCVFSSLLYNARNITWKGYSHLLIHSWFRSTYLSMNYNSVVFVYGLMKNIFLKVSIQRKDRHNFPYIHVINSEKELKMTFQGTVQIDINFQYVVFIAKPTMHCNSFIWFNGLSIRVNI
jgi:hypothetical protein